MKTLKPGVPAFLMILILSLSACGGAQQPASTDGTEETTGVAGNPNAQLVTEQWLRSYLPAQLGSEKINLSGASVIDLMDYQVTKAQATYGEDQSTNLSITDLAKFGSNVRGIMPWLGKDLNITDGGSFQHSGYVENYPSLNTYDAAQQLATVSVLVGSRFLVTATSTSWKAPQLRDAVATIDMDKLAKGE